MNNFNNKNNANNTNNAILLLYCNDQKGIVANISNFIFQNDGNIITSEQHSDTLTNTFFMRIEWDLTNFKIPKNLIAAEFTKNIATKFNIQYNVLKTLDIFF